MRPTKCVFRVGRSTGHCLTKRILSAQDSLCDVGYMGRKFSESKHPQVQIMDLGGKEASSSEFEEKPYEVEITGYKQGF